MTAYVYPRECHIFIQLTFGLWNEVKKSIEMAHVECDDLTFKSLKCNEIKTFTFSQFFLFSVASLIRQHPAEQVRLPSRFFIVWKKRKKEKKKKKKKRKRKKTAQDSFLIKFGLLSHLFITLHHNHHVTPSPVSVCVCVCTHTYINYVYGYNWVRIYTYVCVCLYIRLKMLTKGGKKINVWKNIQISWPFLVKYNPLGRKKEKHAKLTWTKGMGFTLR